LIGKLFGRLAMITAGGLLLYVGVVIVTGTVSGVSASGSDPDEVNRNAAQQLFEKGREIFRFDTFGDEAFWGGTLQLHEAIKGARLGGVGPGVSPRTALAVGLKVDSAALPSSLKQALSAGQVDLDDPATTVALLKLDAVVGLKGFFASDGSLNSIGLTCASCHSMVDDSFAPGIGRRLDGWANRDLNVGAIISLAPNKSALTTLLQVDEATLNAVLAAWGPGKFDAELFLDGKGFRPDGTSAATLIPPAFGLAGVNLHTYTGWGSVTYWNAFVANLEMHGKGTFFDPRLNDPVKFPVAVRARFFDVRNTPDLITPKLPALHAYQLGLLAPKPPPGSFDAAAAKRGERIFTGKGTCATCHVLPLFTEPGWNLHEPAEICTDAFQANRSPDGRYRTTPLKGLFTHMKGGFWHDGRFANLAAVVEHYDSCFGLGLTAQEKSDLVQYLLSN
jgi:mono/diheme cytochrome c family protein/cytochrome c553